MAKHKYPKTLRKQYEHKKIERVLDVLDKKHKKYFIGVDFSTTHDYYSIKWPVIKAGGRIQQQAARQIEEILNVHLRSLP